MIKKRLIINARPLDSQTAGIHRFTFELLNALHNYGQDLPFEVIIIREKNDNLFPNFKTIILPNIGWIPLYEMLYIFIVIPFITRKHKADIAFEPAHMGPFNLPKAIKRITFIHDLTPLIMPQYHRFLSAKVQKVFLPKVLKKATLILANSNHTKADVLHYFPFTEGKVKKLYLGVNEKFKPTQKKDFLVENNINEGYFLSVCTIEPRKNLPTLVKAFDIYKSESLRNTKLILVGKQGWKTKTFQNIISKSKYSKDIILTGFVKDDSLVQLYSHCKAFIYPSKYEGFGLSIAEAASCGAPCIVARNSSLVEVTNSEELLFETLDHLDLAIKMQSVSAKEDQTLKTEINKLFCWKNTAKEFIEIIHSLIKDK